jgi:hypothetical protein
VQVPSPYEAFPDFPFPSEAFSSLPPPACFPFAPASFGFESFPIQLTIPKPIPNHERQNSLPKINKLKDSAGKEKLK